VAHTSVGASVMHECALETRESSYVPRAAKPFFIPVLHSPPGVVGHVAALEAQSRGTRGSTRAHLIKEARSGAEGHATASELTSARR
jgi:hypothetical protein